MPNKTLVLGATGLLGSHLLWELTQKGSVLAGYRNEKRIEDVRKLFLFYDKTIGDQRFQQIEWRRIDILDFSTLEEAIREASQVYHAAALVSFHRIDFYRCIKQNREGTANVVTRALRIRRSGYATLVLRQPLEKRKRDSLMKAICGSLAIKTVVIRYPNLGRKKRCGEEWRRASTPL